MSNVIYRCAEEINWNDSRITSRVEKIKTFVQTKFKKPYQEEQLNTKKIREIFGSQSNQCSKFFKELILIRDTSPEKLYVVGKKSLTYTINWNNLALALEKSNQIKTENSFTQKNKLRTFDDFGTNKKAFEIINKSKIKTTESKTFDKKFLKENAVYKTCPKTKRKHNPIQNIPKEMKKIIFKGWYDYDIEACSYSLIHQHLVNRVLPWLNEQNSFSIIPQVYQDKNKIRQKLATELNVEVSIIKELLQHILFNASVNQSPFSGFRKTLNDSRVNITMFMAKIKGNKFINSLISELQEVWPKLFAYYDAHNDVKGRDHFKKKIKNNKTQYRAASFRAGIYFLLEKEVLEIVKKFIPETQVCHLMHDGFFTNTAIDVTALEDMIFKETSFKVKYSSQQF